MINEKLLLFKYNLTKTIVYLTIGILLIFLLLRITNILPRNGIIILIIIFMIIFLSVSLKYIGNNIENLYLIQIIIAFMFLFSITAVTIIEKKFIILIWFNFLIVSYHIISTKKISYMFFLFFLFTELLLCTYIFKNYSIFNKITIILSLIFFNILGFIISIQLEKFAYEIEAQRILLEKVTMIDFLTNTYNRRAFFKLSKMMINDAIRENQNIAVIMMDIDFFKKINDTYGHNTGDNVLKEFSELIKSNIRNNDLFARIGGEEFILMIKNADEPTIKQLVSKLINLIHNMSIKSNNKNIKITVSMGIYIFNPRFESLENAIKKADIALYKAKEKRDRFIFYEENLKDFLSA